MPVSVRCGSTLLPAGLTSQTLPSLVPPVNVSAYAQVACWSVADTDSQRSCYTVRVHVTVHKFSTEKQAEKVCNALVKHGKEHERCRDQHNTRHSARAKGSRGGRHRDLGRFGNMCSNTTQVNLEQDFVIFA